MLMPNRLSSEAEEALIACFRIAATHGRQLRIARNKETQTQVALNTGSVTESVSPCQKRLAESDSNFVDEYNGVAEEGIGNPPTPAMTVTHSEHTQVDDSVRDLDLSCASSTEPSEHLT